MMPCIALKPTGAHRPRWTGGLIIRFMLILSAPIASAHADTGQTTLPPPGAAGSTAYVLASRANLRAQAQASAPVLAQPVTNTPVRLIANNGEWCEVEVLTNDAMPPGVTPTTSVTSAAQRGFIACNLLTAQMLTLAVVDAQFAKGKLNAKAALDWYSRAFWIAPSMARWMRVGIALQDTHLDEETRAREITETKPLRFKVAEFEAMKQRLAAGILVKPEATNMMPGLALEDPQLSYTHAQAAGKRITLPVIKPSLFKANETPVIISTEKYAQSGSSRTIDLIDTLSAANGAPFRTVVTAPASYALNSDTQRLAGNAGWRFIRVSGAMDIIIGVWDVGGLHVTYSQDTVLHGVSVRGEPTAQNIKEIKWGIGDSSACSYSRTSVEMKSLPIAGYAPPSSAMVSWAGKPMPGGTSARAQVKSRQIRGTGEYDLVVAHEIDLDRDAIADFLIWQGRYQPQVSAEGHWSGVFGNIGGQWRLLDYVEDADCT